MFVSEWFLLEADKNLEMENILLKEVFEHDVYCISIWCKYDLLQIYTSTK